MPSLHQEVSRLPDISEVQPYDVEKDRVLFMELKQVLEKHGASRRFGISLLHQHFDIGSNEVLCEATDAIARVQEIRPISKTELSREPHIITNWRLDLGEPLMGCVCKPINGHGHYHVP